MFRLVSYGGWLLAPRATSKLEDHSPSTVHDCLFNIRSDYKWCERLHKFIGKNRSHHL